MKISLAWLREFVNVPTDPRRLKADLTRIGLNVESCVAAGDDWVFDIEVTSNRPDCLSHYGVAREAAALYKKPLKPPALRVRESSAKASGAVRIEIADRDLCGRYCGRVIHNVRVAPSPDWLARRLESIGQRPINNVADATNYVLMELGHPLHAFDLARLRGSKVIVRRARSGEPLRTLDGGDRKLTTENLVIADAERAVALAGIMGGEESEISAATTDVLLESAWFLPTSIRGTAKALGMRTEASYRFERGADIEMARRAIDRTAELIRELAGGEVLAGVVDVYPGRKARPAIALTESEIARVLGTEIPAGEIERILRALGFELARQGRGKWRVKPPSFRPDVTREVDLVEEIARHVGYDRLPARVRPAPPRLERDLRRAREQAISECLVGLGYREIIPSSMIAPEENARFTDRPPVILANPLSQDASALRSSALPSMVRALRWNLDRDQTDVRFFESGRTYTASGRELPDERRVLALGLMGHRHPVSVHATGRPLDFFDLKGDLETLFELFDVSELRFEPSGCAPYEPELSGRFNAGSEALAVFGQLRGDLTHEYKLRQPVWLAEIELDRLLALPLRSSAFLPFSKFPAVERDFSLVIPDAVSYAKIEETLRGIAIEEMREVRPADWFRGGSLPTGHYSLMVRVTFQSSTRTLTSEETAEAGRRIVAVLEPLGIRLRG